jgi:hypothetical protein
MEIKIGDHENHRHWDHMLRKDLPLGAKTIMAILSFKQSINASSLLKRVMKNLFWLINAASTNILVS